MGPDESRERAERALALLDSGSGVRAVAREIGCAPSAVVYWRRAAKAGTLGAWDRHGTAGGRYSDDDCARARARRTLRISAGGAPDDYKSASPASSAFIVDDHERRRRGQQPDWLNARRVQVAYVRLALKLPLVVGKRVIAQWDQPAMEWAFELHALQPADGSTADDDAELLQEWPDLPSLFVYRLICMGFVRSEDGIWSPPPEAEAQTRLATAMKVGSWPVTTQ